MEFGFIVGADSIGGENVAPVVTDDLKQNWVSELLALEEDTYVQDKNYSL